MTPSCGEGEDTSDSGEKGEKAPLEGRTGEPLGDEALDPGDLAGDAKELSLLWPSSPAASPPAPPRAGERPLLPPRSGEL